MQESARALIGYALELLRPSWKLAVFSTLMGIVNGLAAVCLLSIIDRQIQSTTALSTDRLAAFGALLALLFASEIASGAGNSVVGQAIVAGLRKDLVKKILHAPIDELERARNHRIIAALTTDVNQISEYSRGLSYLVVAICEAVACAIYLAYTSFQMFLAVAGAGIVVYLFLRRASALAYAAYSEERGSIDVLQKHYRALLEGAKELRVNRGRRHRFYDEQVTTTIDRIRVLTNRASLGFVTGVAIDSSSFFIVAGVLLVLTPHVDRAAIPNFIMVLLFLRGPIGQILLSLPMFGLALVSFRNVSSLARQFSSTEFGLAASTQASFRPFAESLRLRNVSYQFPPVDGAPPFRMGPFDLEIRKGEIVFIVGENGSGKTTLVKLLLGLYTPQTGNIFLDGKIVENRSRDEYRQFFSAIFFDFFLFDDLIECGADQESEIKQYLSTLDIADDVAVKDGAFTTLDLSAGQRKRLALVEVFLEDRPIVVLDEWAAEQDPTFRRVFYESILPEMKRRGRTLIVVSHDDRYFHVADRIVKIAEGRLCE